MRILPVVILLFLLSISLSAQDTRDPISADNIERLQSVQTMDFADAPDDVTINTGWFTLSPDGQYIAVVRTEGGLAIWNAEGELEESYAIVRDNLPATVLDARFSASGELISAIHTADGQNHIVSLYTIGDDTPEIIDFPDGYGVPVRVWLSGDEQVVFVETIPDYTSDDEDEHLVVSIPRENPDDISAIPAAPEYDDESFVRIGRIAAPLAITTTFDAIARRWNLETGELTGEVQLELTPVFGRVNEANGRYLVWRDQAGLSLNLLDFETEENQVVSEMDGEYIQALLLTPNADVIIAVHTGDAKTVTAWKTETGEFIELGEYRNDCSRVPDMVQLSEDGARLVIGCDVGLDVWQVVPVD